MAVWIFALTAAAQQATDKPSPVPRRASAAGLCAHAAGEVRTTIIAQHKTQTKRTPPGNPSRSVRAPVPIIRRRPASLASFLQARTAG